MGAAPKTEIRIVRGLSDAHRPRAAELYLEAFGQKLGPFLGRDARAVAFLDHVMRPSHALVALNDQGVLLGLAGFHDTETGLVGGEFHDLTRFYGLLGGIWRAAFLSIFERAPASGEFLMDGIVVAPEARGQGVGSALLAAVLSTARGDDATQVRLDVINANPRAQALYERTGFMAKETKRYGIFTRWLGFSAVTPMIYSL